MTGLTTPEASRPAETAEAAAERGLAASRLGKQMKALHRYISSQVMGAMQEQLQDDDLSFSQMSALHQLRAHAPLSVGGLAERTGLSLPAASHLTDRLVVRGYAQRRENPDDRRAKLLDLSERGQQIVDEMDRRFSDTYRAAFGRVSLQTIQVTADSLGALLGELLEGGPDGCVFPESQGISQTLQRGAPLTSQPGQSTSEPDQSIPDPSPEEQA